VDRISGCREPLQYLERDHPQTLPAEVLADLAHRELRRETSDLLDRVDRLRERFRLLPRFGCKCLEMLDPRLRLGEACRQEIAFELRSLKKLA